MGTQLLGANQRKSNVFLQKRPLNYDINNENTNTFINVYLQKKHNENYAGLWYGSLCQSIRNLNLPPNSAFPFFDWKKITMPALVLFIISMGSMVSTLMRKKECSVLIDFLNYYFRGAVHLLYVEDIQRTTLKVITRLNFEPEIFSF